MPRGFGETVAKRGSSSLDWIIGLLLLLSSVVVTFYYATYMVMPTQPFQATLETTAGQLAENLRANVSLTVYKMPVFISSSSATIWPTELPFRENNTDSNSLVVVDSRSNELPSQLDNETFIWIPSLAQAKNNTFYLVYTKATNFTRQNYSTDLAATTSSISNSLISASFSSRGITSLRYSGNDLLDGLCFSNTCQTFNMSITVGAVRAVATFDGIKAKIYANSSKIALSGASQIRLNLSSSLTSYYNGTGINTFSGQGATVFSGTANFVDFWSSAGIAIIGKNMAVTIYDGAYKEVTVNGQFEIYTHAGAYTNALAESELYLNPPEILIGVPESITGFSEEAIQKAAEGNYEDLRKALGLGDVNFNITVIK